MAIFAETHERVLAALDILEFEQSIPSGMLTQYREQLADDKVGIICVDCGGINAGFAVSDLRHVLLKGEEHAAVTRALPESNQHHVIVSAPNQEILDLIPGKIVYEGRKTITVINGNSGIIFEDGIIHRT